MTLLDRLAQLEQQKPMSTIKLGLERVKACALALDLIDQKPIVIMVAGTNGKGSTIATLEQLLLSHNQKVGKYTSPHLLTFNERICINAQQISDERILYAFDLLDSIESAKALTYYEWVTLSALILFKNEPLDYLLLEVGLGGRLDAVNIIDADISLITSIDYDHMALLGNTLPLIAFEKAGIFREEQKVFSSETNPPSTLLAEASKKNTHYKQLNLDYSYKRGEGFWDFLSPQKKFYKLPMPSLHLNNVTNALACFLSLNIKTSKKKLKESLSLVTLPGRAEIMGEAYPVLFDVAHNAQSIQYLAQRLSQLPQKPLMVFSMLEDKAIEQCINFLKPYVKSWFIAPLDSPRSLSKEALDKAFSMLPYQSFSSINEAFLEAKKVQVNKQVVVVAGSFLTVSEVKSR